MASLVGKRILIVEDDGMIAMMIEEEFLEAGAVVVIAATIVEALASIAFVDVAMLDCNIGGQSILPVADRLADLSVPFAFVTGYGENFDRGRHITVSVVSKPFRCGALVSLAISLLSSTDGARTI